MVAEELNYTLPSKYHYEQFDNTFNLTVASHGNMNSLKSADVIRKIKSEDASKCRFSDEMFQARSKDNQVRNKGISTQNCEGNKKKLRKRRIDCCRIQNDHTCISGKNNYLHVESNELSSDDSILVTKSDDIQTYDHGELSPVNPSWQKRGVKK